MSIVLFQINGTEKLLVNVSKYSIFFFNLTRSKKKKEKNYKFTQSSLLKNCHFTAFII